MNIFDYGARHYDPAIGRWFVVDPLAELAPNWTPYRYGFNNPMKYTDPTGMFEYVKGGYGEDIEVGNVWSHTEDGGYNSDKKEKGEKAASESAGVNTNLGLATEELDKMQNRDGTNNSNKRKPSETQRKDGQDYGYTGVSEHRDGKEWYQMSDKQGRLFWVDKDWNGRGGINMFDYLPGGKYFGNTQMGKDINSIFKFIDKVVKANQDYGRTDPSGIYTLPLPSDPDGFPGRPYLLIPIPPIVLN